MLPAKPARESVFSYRSEMKWFQDRRSSFKAKHPTEIHFCGQGGEAMNSRGARTSFFKEEKKIPFPGFSRCMACGLYLVEIWEHELWQVTRHFKCGFRVAP
jgi:hypothetical protein